MCINSIRQWLFQRAVISVLDGGLGDFQSLAIAKRVAINIWKTIVLVAIVPCLVPIEPFAVLGVQDPVEWKGV